MVGASVHLRIHALFHAYGRVGGPCYIDMFTISLDKGGIEHYNGHCNGHYMVRIY